MLSVSGKTKINYLVFRINYSNGTDRDRSVTKHRIKGEVVLTNQTLQLIVG